MPFGMKAVEAWLSKVLAFILSDKRSPMPFGMKAVEANPNRRRSKHDCRVTNAFRHKGR